ncbi:hypothetical protein OH76DRAFT_862570 [Lentinus brumalis]|uniref:Uncharacterized protein n=1 Tax=Lentinus brumalis TaxID=2498619 RepID=A0A371DR96_9APHY|nr:hypothetical protein OH76DRAFT_862570 [Polyporus brumalis]
MYHSIGCYFRMHTLIISILGRGSMENAVSRWPLRGAGGAGGWGSWTSSAGYVRSPCPQRKWTSVLLCAGGRWQVDGWPGWRAWSRRASARDWRSILDARLGISLTEARQQGVQTADGVRYGLRASLEQREAALPARTAPCSSARDVRSRHCALLRGRREAPVPILSRGPVSLAAGPRPPRE